MTRGKGSQVYNSLIECVNVNTGERTTVDNELSHADFYYLVDSKGYGQYIRVGDWRFSAWRCRKALLPAHG